jgi:HEAT repeat protein
MTTHKQLGTLIAAVLFAGIALGPTSAFAGRGGSAAKIRAAANTGSVDAILAEVERAERRVCGECIGVVMDLLDNDRAEVRQVAAWWFARRPALKDELTARSIADLSGNDARLARNAADILGEFHHPGAVPALNAAVTRTDLTPEARVRIVHALGTIGHPSGNAGLQAAMADSDASVRAEAAAQWLEIRGQQGAAPVAPLVDDSDAMVRRKATAVVGGLREASARASLEARLATDTDPVVRRNAAWALGRIGDRASRPALEAAQQDASSLVRATARAAIALLH